MYSFEAHTKPDNYFIFPHSLYIFQGKTQIEKKWEGWRLLSEKSSNLNIFISIKGSEGWSVSLEKMEEQHVNH